MPKTTHNAALSSNIGRLTATFMQMCPEGETMRKNGKVVAHPLQNKVLRYLWALSRAGTPLPALMDLRHIYLDAKANGKNPIIRFDLLTETATPPSARPLDADGNPIVHVKSPVQIVLAAVLPKLSPAKRRAFSSAITKFAWAHYKVEGTIEAEDITSALESFETPEELTAFAEEVKDALPKPAPKAKHPVQVVLADTMAALDSSVRRDFNTAITKFAWAHYKKHEAVSVEVINSALATYHTPEELVAHSLTIAA
jgi:hypothetical protein